MQVAGTNGASKIATTTGASLLQANLQRCNLNLGLRVHQVATTAGASKATSAKGKALLGMALPWPRGSSLSKAPSALAPCMASYIQNNTPWEIPPKQP
ncbi:hypothetical protein HKD37_07G019021 [Glycine soja]